MNTMLKGIASLVTLTSFLWWNLAVAAPDGAQVAAGSADISQSGTTTTINQSSQNAVINWNGFNTTAAETVQFNQPNSSAIALNRIMSGMPTQFDGSLLANGHVWIVNPAGVVFGASSRIDVAGLVTTTLNIQDNNFMNGQYKFDLVPGFENAKIINNGLISAKNSGLVVLVAPGVENNGIIQANLGKVVLASGSSFILDLYGDQLINFGTSAPVANGYISNSGLISATGGKILITANSAAQLLDNVISMSGVIEAKTASTGAHGEIILNGGHAGNVKISGTLDASDGGYVETSGYLLDLTGMVLKVGMGGTWYVDPFNITIVPGAACVGSSGCPPFSPLTATSTIGVNTITGQLNGGVNVILDTGVPGGDAGDIIITTDIISTGSGNLTLNAARNININTANINTNTGSLTLNGFVILGVPLVTVTASNATFVKTTQGPNALSVVGNAEFDDNIGTIGTFLTSLTVTGNTLLNKVGIFGLFSNATIFQGFVDANNSDTTRLVSFGSVEFNKDVGSTNRFLELDFAGDITLNATPLNIFSDTTVIEANLDGNSALTLHGDFLGFTSGIGVTTPLILFRVTGATNLENSITIHATLAQFDGTVDTSADTADSSLNVQGNAQFGGEVGAFNPLFDVIVSQTTILTPTTLNMFVDDLANFNGTVNGATAFTVHGNAQFGGVVGGNTPLTSLEITGTTVVTPSITTTGFQQYDGAMTLLSDVSLVSDTGNIILNVVDGLFGLTLNSNTGNLNFNGAVGGINILTSVLAVTGSSSINGTQTITLNAPITTSGTGYSIILASDIFNAGAAGTLNPGAGNFQVWSIAPYFNNENSIARNFNQFSSFYGITPVGSPGNGFLYRVGSAVPPTSPVSLAPTFFNPFIPNILAGETLPDIDAFALSNNIEIFNLTNNIPVGIVLCLCGFETATDPLGNIRILQSGDKIYAGDKVEGFRDNKGCRPNIKALNTTTLGSHPSATTQQKPAP